MLKMDRSASKISEKEREVQRYRTLYVFGVPLEYKDKDIANILNYYKMKVKYVEWKMREDMEYLIV
jgi:hypothetical protein